MRARAAKLHERAMDAAERAYPLRQGDMDATRRARDAFRIGYRRGFIAATREFARLSSANPNQKE